MSDFGKLRLIFGKSCFLMIEAAEEDILPFPVHFKFYMSIICMLRKKSLPRLR